MSVGCGQRAVVENNSLSDKDAKNQGLLPVKIIPVNPLMESIGVVNQDGGVDLPKGGAKGSVAKKPGEITGKSGTQAESKQSRGAENTAIYPKLKDDLVQQNMNNIAKQDPRLGAVVKGDNGKLNYGVGSGTKAEADQLGKVWVGDGARLTSDKTGLMSADGTRVYRFPASKDNSAHAITGTQANFETFKINPVTGDKTKIGNGHLDIK